MVEIGFYHLTRSPVAVALPALLARTRALGEKALVACPDEATLKHLDAALWTCPTPDWLPHGTAATPHPEWQPVYLTTGPENPAKAAFLFRISGAGEDVAAYARVFDLFDGTDEAQLQGARARWRAAKAAGHALTYWKQEETGWVKAGL